MKNKFSNWCYVCGEFVDVGEGIAEQVARTPGGPGHGSTRWVVRHSSCAPPEKPDTDKILEEYVKNYNQHHYGN